MTQMLEEREKGANKHRCWKRGRKNYKEWGWGEEKGREGGGEKGSGGGRKREKRRGKRWREYEKGEREGEKRQKKASILGLN